jgi:isoleucyl-tRNA synthetase
MISNAQPWDNLKFDVDGITEVQRKFFGTLYNTYGFFALYANVDGFDGSEAAVPHNERPEIDRWVLSQLHSLIKNVNEHYNAYEPTRAARAISYFVTEELSNWYVRLCRRRFWKGSYSTDKISAYQTLYECLEKVAQIAAPIAPFYMDRLFIDLNKVSGKQDATSVHLSSFPESNADLIDEALEKRMDVAQRLSSIVLGLRKKEKIKVRQPLQKIMVPVASEEQRQQLLAVKELVLSEVNVKELEFLAEDSGVFVKRIKPNFKAIGPRYGKHMKAIASQIAAMDQTAIREFERDGALTFELENEPITLDLSDVEIVSDDIPGFLVASNGNITAALDVTLNEELLEEGIARELVNRIQNFRKESGLAVTDKINLKVKQHTAIDSAVKNNKHYICAETLAEELELVENIEDSEPFPVEFDEGVKTAVAIEKLMN